MHASRVAMVLTGLGMLALSPAARAQSADEQSPSARALGGNSAPGGVGAPGGSSGFGPRNPSPAVESGATSMPELKPIVEPRQRLDVGALLCGTEAQLKQHQTAIMARMAGRSAPEPVGCHIVGETMAVAVLRRDGQAVTQVQIAGDTPRTGWTDAFIRDVDPLHSPMK